MARSHHALLLVGAPGVARTAALRLVAERLCERPLAAGACGACDACSRVQRGAHPDVHWLGAVGPLGVPEARALCRAAALSPAGRASVFVVEACERLTGFAAAALLKTLEEPPGLSVFMLLADQADRIEPTLRSRCQLVRLGNESGGDPGLTAAAATEGPAGAAPGAKRRGSGQRQRSGTSEALQGDPLADAIHQAFAARDVAGALAAAAALADGTAPMAALTAAVRDVWLQRLGLLEAAGGPRSGLGAARLADLASDIRIGEFAGVADACASAEAAEAARVNPLMNWEYVVNQLRRLHNAC